MLQMEPSARSVSWEAPEHHHRERGGDWFFALAIITASVAIASVFFGNILFALLALLSGMSLALAASQVPQIIPFAVTIRGIRVGETMYPYSVLHSYFINEEDIRGPQLLILGKRHFMPLIVMPIPEEYIDEIEEILSSRLPEEFIEEPFFNKLLEFLGF